MASEYDRHGVTCQDCVVAVTARRGSAGHLGAEELRALAVLADAGMIPPLRLGRASSPRSPKPGKTSRTWAFPASRAS